MGVHYCSRDDGEQLNFCRNPEPIEERIRPNHSSAVSVLPPDEKGGRILTSTQWNVDARFFCFASLVSVHIFV